MARQCQRDLLIQSNKRTPVAFLMSTGRVGGVGLRGSIIPRSAWGRVGCSTVSPGLAPSKGNSAQGFGCWQHARQGLGHGAATPTRSLCRGTQS